MGKKMRIGGFRLLTGEDIIAIVVESYGIDKVKLKKPAIIAMMQEGTGKTSVGLADYLPFADASRKEIEINKDKIVFEYEPAIDIVNAYSTRFGSGLIVPQKLSLPQGAFPFTTNQ